MDRVAISLSRLYCKHKKIAIFGRCQSPGYLNNHLNKYMQTTSIDILPYRDYLYKNVTKDPVLHEYVSVTRVYPFYNA